MERSLERLLQIGGHLSPSSVPDGGHPLSAAPAAAAPPPSSAKDEVFEDEDESKFVYEEIPPEQRIIGTNTAATALARPRTYTLPNGKQVEISFRRYIEGEDDAAFQKLDAECRQGKTGLESVFFLKEPWSAVQRGTDCIVATPANEPKNIIATARGSRKWVYLNGRKAPASYHYLLRVSPPYRGVGLAEFAERILLNIDYDHGVRYFIGYVVEDNKQSMALMQRILHTNDSLQVELKRWLVSGYSPKNFSQKLNSYEPGKERLKVSVRQIEGVRAQVDHARKAFAGHQLLPTDLSRIFRSHLSEGTYAAYAHGDPEPLASFCVWNSGAVRSSRLPSNKEFLFQPCVFYNTWTNPKLSKEQGVGVVATLLSTVAEEIDKKGTHGFIYNFLMEDHPLAGYLAQSAEFYVAWKARLWYWNASFEHDPKTGCELAFDPRDSLQ